jgi:hypothetical protein
MREQRVSRRDQRKGMKLIMEIENFEIAHRVSISKLLLHSYLHPVIQNQNK